MQKKFIKQTPSTPNNHYISTSNILLFFVPSYKEKFDRSCMRLDDMTTAKKTNEVKS